MGLLNGDLAGVFAAAFGPIYEDAILHRSTFTDDGEGGGAVTWADEAVKAQLDHSYQGTNETGQRILVLADGVSLITSDHEITLGGVRYTIGRVERDPARTHYVLIGAFEFRPPRA